MDNPSSACPYCGVLLEKRPQRKKKCPHCGKPIYVRTLPSTRTKVLATEETVQRIDSEWKRINERKRWLAQLQPFGISEQEFEQHKSQFRYNVKDAGVVWSLLNKVIQSNPAGFQAHKMAHYTMALIAAENSQGFRHSLELSAQAELLHYREQGTERVKVLSANERDGACEACLKENGTIYTVEEALRLMPIPNRDCSHAMYGNSGFCRCRYLAHVPLLRISSGETISPPVDIATQNTKVCPWCKGEIPADASVCMHCGRDASKSAFYGQNLTKLGCYLLVLAIICPILYLAVRILLDF